MRRLYLRLERAYGTKVFDVTGVRGLKLLRPDETGDPEAEGWASDVIAEVDVAKAVEAFDRGLR